MPDEARLLLALAVAAAGTFAVTPLAIGVASRANLVDRPAGYKGHATPTPYLGGAAVLCGFLLAAPLLGDGATRLAPIVVFAAVLWVLGTLDDRFTLSPSLRVVVESLAATALWAFDLGWDLFDAEPLNLVVTNLWIVGLVNAFNLMDTMDGAAATVGSVTALATGVMALTQGDVALAALCGALCGACLGFLPYNLAAPSRIFLGDGGSLPVGFISAASIMALSGGGDVGRPLFLAAILLAGVPVVDTTLVVISRRRSGLSVLTAGRDHLTHRLGTRLHSPRAVAGALGVIQGLVGLVAVGTVQLGAGSVVTAWGIWFVAAAAAVVVLESDSWAPERPPPERALPERGRGRGRAPRRPRGPASAVVEGVVVAFITLACGLSPLLYGFYDVSVWGPIALLLLAALFGLVVARPAAPRRSALVASLGLTVVWGWSLLSTLWAESADQAITEANRWLLYAVLFGVLVLLLRNDRVGRLVVASATAAIVGLAVYLTGVLLLGDGPSLFLSGRLHEPLGYANGQAGYLLLGLWPLIAVAERTRRAWVGGAALAASTLIAGLVVLGQTRAVVPAVVLTAVALLVLVPGRALRGWCLLFVLGGVAAVLGPLVEVYEGADPTKGVPDQETVRTAIGLLLLASACVGAAWTLARRAVARAQSRAGQRRVRVAAGVGLAVVAAVAVGLAAASSDPVGKVRDEARAFTDVGSSTEQGTSHFSSGSGNRYDYWRIAAGQFSDSPLKGVGAGNYDRTYFVERRTDEDIRQPHSLGFQTGAELGVVGLVAIALFVLGVLAGAARRARRADESRSDLLLVVAAGGMFLTWLVHTSVDWLHLIPGITGIALCGAAVLVSPWRSAGARRSRRRTAAVVAAAVVVVFGALTVGRNALADHYRSEARVALPGDPVRALSRSGDSLALNDESLPALYVRAAAYSRVDDYRDARAALLEATRREPHDFVPWGLLGDLAVRRGDLGAARAAYSRAAELNPREATFERLTKRPADGLAR